MNDYNIDQLKSAISTSLNDNEESILNLAVWCWVNSRLTAQHVAELITSYLPKGRFISESAIIVHSGSWNNN